MKQDMTSLIRDVYKRQDKILVVAETETGDTAQAEYQLKGTLDATASNVSVDTIESAFLEKEPAEVQTSVSGNPEVKSVFWSSANVSVIPTLGTDTVSYTHLSADQWGTHCSSCAFSIGKCTSVIGHLP